MLRSLHLQGVGPAPSLDLELAPRLNVLTGDNGLGKSFVLDVAWWALTETWVGRPALPERVNGTPPELGASVSLASGAPLRIEASYAAAIQRWEARHALSGQSRSTANLAGPYPSRLLDSYPVIYVRADGGFSIWDPFRNYDTSAGHHAPVSHDPYSFDGSSIWDGLERDGKTLCRGLIEDWVSWQQERDDEGARPFELLSSVLEALSHPDEPMRPGKPRRVFVDDPRRFPTLELPYGNVPVIHASAGMQRILSLAYLLTWAWVEHVEAAKLIGQPPATEILLLVDEVETHLHPRWQRRIATALLTAVEALAPAVRAQVILTTHAPLVLASIEPHFVPSRDKLFLFECDGGEVTLRDVPWTKRGDAVGWLTSEIFGLQQARSPEAERAKRRKP